jgi:hypothetical protein
MVVTSSLKIICIWERILIISCLKLILSWCEILFKIVFLNLDLAQVLNWLVFICRCLLPFWRSQIILTELKATLWIFRFINFCGNFGFMSTFKLVLVEWVSSLIFEYWCALVFRFVSFLLLRGSFKVAQRVF